MRRKVPVWQHCRPTVAVCHTTLITPTNSKSLSSRDAALLEELAHS